MTEYADWRGRPVQVTAETIEAVLLAMGIDTADPERARRPKEHEPWRRMLPPTVVGGGPDGLGAGARDRRRHRSRCGSSSRPASTAPGRPARQLGRRPARSTASRSARRRSRSPATCRSATTWLQARSGEPTAATSLIVTPAWLGLPERADRRAVGARHPAVQRPVRRQSWGVGDLADLTDLAVWSAAEHGADFVLVNPLHAAEPVRADGAVAVPADDAAASPTRCTCGSSGSPSTPTSTPPTATRVDQLVEQLPAGWRRSRPDRPRHRAGRRSAPRCGSCTTCPGAPAGSAAFARTGRREGDGLDDYATWCALAEVHGTDCATWPAELPHPTSAAVAGIPRATTPTGSTSTAGCSGCSTSSWPRTQAEPRRAGMALGVMHDLAVGVHPNGADAWRLQDVFAAGHHGRRAAGPVQPERAGLEPAAVAAGPARRARPTSRSATWSSTVLRHAGGVRVDHVIGLFRLWWIPAGTPGRRGHLRPLRPRGADRHPRAGGAPGAAPWSSARTSARSSRGCATTCASAASSAPRSCGSSSTGRRRRPARRRAVARVLPGLGDHPRPAAHRRLPGR